MKSNKRLITSLLLIFISSSIFGQYKIQEGNNRFSIEMYKKLKSTSKDGNIFFSPFSISTAFTMPYAASTGLTKKQIEGVFSYDENAKKTLKSYKDFSSKIERLDDVTFGIADGLWIDKSMNINASFRKSVQQLTGKDEINIVDFSKNHKAGRSQINQWIEEKTDNNIKDLIPENGINELTRFVMANAIYFKGDWAVKFEENLTATNSFYGLRDSEVPTQFMTKAVADHKYYENSEVQVLELAYKGNSTSMVIVLPRFKDGLEAVENNLNEATYRRWLYGMTKRPVVVSIPKFNLKIQYDLRSTLRKMGLKEPFSDVATFDNMTTEGGLKLGKVFHQSFIVVSEEGTEAAAASAVVGDIKGFKTMPAYFNANQPFLFFIKDNKTDMILFMGRMTEPSFSDEVTIYSPPTRFKLIEELPERDVIHFVEKGETLYRISQKYEVSPEQIRRLNNLSGNIVQLGQELLIQEGESTKGEEVVVDDKSKITKKSGSVQPELHEVYPGESLFSISRKYSLSIDELKKLNDLTDNTIKIGQKLVVQEKEDQIPRNKPESKFVSTPIVIKSDTYKVKKGDTLWKIANENKISVLALKEMNDLTTDILNIGQELVVN